jgi:hypothetical protein
VVLAAGPVGAAGVEVVQGREGEVTGVPRLFEQAFSGEFAGPVRGGGREPVVFVDGHAPRLAVDGCGRREDEAADDGGRGRRDHGRRADHVHVVVALGLLHRLAHFGQRGHVDDGVAAAVEERRLQA